MTFQIHALDEQQFAPLFALSKAELAAQNAVRVVVDEYPGSPCRVSLEDARVGEEVILVNYTHQPESSPYRASHGIFIRPGVKRAEVGKCEVPSAIFNRLISVRGFDAGHMMIAAEVAEGEEIATTIDAFFSDPAVQYIHLHNAKPGCFAAEVARA